MKRSAQKIYLIFALLRLVLFLLGFGLAKMWIGLMVVSLIGIYGLIAYRHLKKRATWVTLLLFIGIAVWGVMSHVSPILLIAGVATALACWELEDQDPASHYLRRIPIEDQFQNYHWKVLGIAVLVGFVLGEAGLFLRIPLPFGMICLIVILISFCLQRLFAFL